jgi:4-amino-4-deoxy-L-arabinose transferase-like glycosyltransferase
MAASAAPATVSTPGRRAAGARALSWAPGRTTLAGLLVLAAGLRFGTLHLQSFWYDEAYTPVHDLHASFSATWHAIVHRENTPPLWYVLAWVDVRIFGNGVIALRSISAIAGVLTVAVAWGIGRELSGPRCAAVLALLTATNPLMVWYSQEARAYALFILFAALALYWFLRAARDPSPRTLWAWAGFGALSLLTHYFAVFLLVPEAAWLLWPVLEGRAAAGTARRVAPAIGLIAVVGAVLIPLIVAQGGHGTQWIGRWALSNRLEAIPDYGLVGYSGSPLGHGIELLVALPAIGALLLAAARGLEQAEARGAALVLGVGVVAILLPLLLAMMGSDYLAPRNLVADYLPLAAALAVLMASPRAGALGLGLGLAGLFAAGSLAVAVDVDLSPRLQRGDWSAVARVMRRGPAGGGVVAAARAIVTPELGAAPLEYYMGPLHDLARYASTSPREIDMVGYAPLIADPTAPPAPGFRFVGRSDEHGLFVYRFLASRPVAVSQELLQGAAITDQQPEVLVAGGGSASAGLP